MTKRAIWYPFNKTDKNIKLLKYKFPTLFVSSFIKNNEAYNEVYFKVIRYSCISRADWMLQPSLSIEMYVCKITSKLETCKQYKLFVNQFYLLSHFESLNFVVCFTLTFIDTIQNKKKFKSWDDTSVDIFTFY